ncbi:guanylyl cyclase inhibitory protein [Acrasis kona]|uniref:Guanylyl cyclase inhibitory protein n=1 Tax=Acrasis kona TaxID=1008807 RepID=A0AAW2ZE87_9EUKA
MGNTQQRTLRKLQSTTHKPDKHGVLWEKLFRSYDKDADGFLTYNDIFILVTDIAKATKLKCSSSPSTIYHAANNFTRHLDGDNDKLVSKGEFMRGINALFSNFVKEQKELDHDKRKQSRVDHAKAEQILDSKLKTHTDRLRREKGIDSVGDFLENTKWLGFHMPHKEMQKQKYEVYITTISKNTFVGYRILGTESENITGEFNLRLDWNMVEVSFQDNQTVHEAKFSVRDEVPNLSGPCNRIGDNGPLGVFSIKYRGKINE